MMLLLRTQNLSIRHLPYHNPLWSRPLLLLSSNGLHCMARKDQQHGLTVHRPLRA